MSYGHRTRRWWFLRALLVFSCLGWLAVWLKNEDLWCKITTFGKKCFTSHAKCMFSLPAGLSIYPSIYLSIYLSIHLSSIYPSIYVAIYLSVYLSIYLSIERSIDLSFYVSIKKIEVLKTSKLVFSSQSYHVIWAEGEKDGVGGSSV